MGVKGKSAHPEPVEGLPLDRPHHILPTCAGIQEQKPGASETRSTKFIYVNKPPTLERYLIGTRY